MVRCLGSTIPGGVPMTKHLENLLEAAKKAIPTQQEKEEQRRSFAYGNTKIENDLITREMVNQVAEELKRSK